MKMKRKTINIDPFSVEIKNQEGKIEMSFYGKKNLVKFHMPRWWISYIAKQLHAVVKDERQKLDAIDETLRNG